MSLRSYKAEGRKGWLELDGRLKGAKFQDQLAIQADLGT